MCNNELSIDVAQVMVPFGRQAFFPGQLTHTNEFLVHLGDQYYVETTAAAAQGILQRKLAVVTDGVQNAEKQLQSLRARLEITQNTFGDGTSADGAVEIRSTLEESDDLLAAAGISRRPHRSSSAAAATLRQRKRQQQKQQPVSRVTAAAGYSYTPLDLPEPTVHVAPQPQQQQRELAHDDSALQARLEELIRLEEQQEIAELEQRQQQQQPQQFLQQQQLQQQQQRQQQQYQQQQQQWQQEALASIAEGDEEQDEASAAGAAGSSRLFAAERLQQLEAEADSDDEEQQHHGQQQLPQGQTQQQKDQLSATALPAVKHHQTASSHQSLQRQIHQQPQPSAPESADGQAPASPAGMGRKPLKSALKKGFLAHSGPIAQPLNSAKKVDAVHAVSTSQNKPKGIGSQAFTGAVVERLSPAEPGGTGGGLPPHAAPVSAVLEKPVAASSGAGSAAVDSSSGGPRVSKFKLRRMGLEPPE